uniref:Large ribosomal subunit protein uL24c n=1 Tax=Antithamnionella ternifolia TaxID=207919 RepID=A0A4D6WMV2_9FLOR|nr:ribosomal protein L24 [Antithamnionella ternifolia]
MQNHKHKIRIKKNDDVIIINGKNKGQRGKVIQIIRKKNTAIIENINLKTKHQKPIRENETGSIEKKPAPINISNIALI